MKMVTFTVPGPPQGKARARTYRNQGVTRTVTPEKTVLYENLIKTEYERQTGGYRFLDDSPIAVVIDAYYPIPKSMSKKNREKAKTGELKPMKKPDVDNIAKVICDALNGVAYQDDKNVVMLNVSKCYSDEPKVVVQIIEVVP